MPMVENERNEHLEKAIKASEILAFSMANTYNNIFRANGWHETIRDGIEMTSGDLPPNLFRGIHFQTRGDSTFSNRIDDVLSAFRKSEIMHFLAPYYREVLIKTSTKQRLLINFSKRSDSHIILPGLIKFANLFDSRLGIE